MRKLQQNIDYFRNKGTIFFSLLKHFLKNDIQTCLSHTNSPKNKMIYKHHAYHTETHLS